MDFAIKFKYQSLDDAIRLLKPGYHMAKVDLRHAYMSVNILPNIMQLVLNGNLRVPVR